MNLCVPIEYVSIPKCPLAEEALRDFFAGSLPHILIFSGIVRTQCLPLSFWSGWIRHELHFVCLSCHTILHGCISIRFVSRYFLLVSFCIIIIICFDTSRSFIFSHNASSTFYQLVCVGSSGCEPNIGSFWCHHGWFRRYIFYCK